MKRLMQFDLAAPHFRFPLRWMPRVAAIFIALFASLAALTATAPNPLPHIDILQPVSAAPGQSFTLAIIGTGFIASSVVNWNGRPQTTTYISGTQITATISDADTATASTASITVSSPSPGGGTSNVVLFPVTTATPSVNTSPAVLPISRPYGIAVGDMNRDGIPDLLVAQFSANTVEIYYGTSTGTFSTTPDVAIPVGANPRSIVVADFNGDGIPDFAVACRGDNQVQIYLGQSDGTFLAAAPLNTAVGPENLVAGDFNGDGVLDLAVVHLSTDVVDVFLGNGDGTFQTAVSYPLATSSESRFLTTGDFNGDGHLDLAVSNSGPGVNTVSVLLGNGDGTFQPRVDYTTGASPYGVIAADFNGDGILDLAVANSASSSVSILLGNGDGTFQPKVDYATGIVTMTQPSLGPQDLVAGDFNGDGNLDLAEANDTVGTVGILLGKGDGTFAAPAFPLSTGSNSSTGSPNNPSKIAVADFNGDGRLDLVTTNFASNSVSVLLQAPLVQITIQTSAPGLQVSVDGGASQAAPVSVTWQVGSTHTIATTSVQTTNGSQYTFAS